MPEASFAPAVWTGLGAYDDCRKRNISTSGGWKKLLPHTAGLGA